MVSLEEILSQFKTISLAETDNVRLMNRTETKYTFLRSHLPGFLEQVMNEYEVLEINNHKLNAYETIYFDTPAYSLYLQHHNFRQNRYKIRQRLYASSGDSFLEIKFKTNKNRTIKNRVATDSIKSYIEDAGLNLIKAKTPLNPLELIPTLWVYFSRITLVNNNKKERLTIDVDITFKINEKIIKYSEIAVAEIKQENICDSPFVSLMKTNRVRTESISKYCFGLISIKDNIKKNNFKHKLMIIKKLYNEN